MNKNLEEIYKIYSVSSSEKKLNHYLKRQFLENNYDIVEDNLYSIFAKKSSETNYNFMVACAMDEIGLMVERILPDGRLKFLCLETQSPASLLNQRVNIVGRDYQNYKGIISIDKKILEDELNTVKIEDLYIDVFYPSSNDKKVKIGDLVTLDSEFLETETMYVGRSLNQKIFQLIELDLIKKLKDEKFDFNLFIGSIAQSTVGYRGTKTATYVVEPSIAIVLTAFEVNNSKPDINLGDGIIVGYYDKQLIPNQDLLRYITENYETKPYLGILGNDGSFIHKTLNGTPTISLGIPMKNMGTSSVIVMKRDIDKLVDFMIHFIKNFNYNKFIDMGK